MLQNLSRQYTLNALISGRATLARESLSSKSFWKYCHPKLMEMICTAWEFRPGSVGLGARQWRSPPAFSPDSRSDGHRSLLLGQSPSLHPEKA